MTIRNISIFSVFDKQALYFRSTYPRSAAVVKQKYEVVYRIYSHQITAAVSCQHDSLIFSSPMKVPPNSTHFFHLAGIHCKCKIIPPP